MTKQHVFRHVNEATVADVTGGRRGRAPTLNTKRWQRHSKQRNRFAVAFVSKENRVTVRNVCFLKPNSFLFPI